MSFNSLLLSGMLLKAAGIYVVAVIIVELLSAHLTQAVHHVRVTAWIVEHVGIPLARTATLLLFIFAAYPLLYGVSWAPPLTTLLFDDEGHLRYLLNSVFLVTLLLPLLPLSIARIQLILPIQGITATALLFHWSGSAMGRGEMVYWPGNLPVLAIVTLGFLIGPIASAIGRFSGDAVDRLFERYDGEQLVTDGVTLLLQLPLLLIYTLSVGRQLNGM